MQTIIALACMTYIINLDAYELHPGDEKIFNNFINECLGSTSIHMIGFISIIEYNYVNDYI